MKQTNQTNLTANAVAVESAIGNRAPLWRVAWFGGWRGAILTDSGGYQIFSLRGRRTISERARFSKARAMAPNNC